MAAIQRSQRVLTWFYLFTILGSSEVLLSKGHYDDFYITPHIYMEKICYNS